MFLRHLFKLLQQTVHGNSCTLSRKSDISSSDIFLILSAFVIALQPLSQSSAGGPSRKRTWAYRLKSGCSTFELMGRIKPKRPPTNSHRIYSQINLRLSSVSSPWSGTDGRESNPPQAVLETTSPPWYMRPCIWHFRSSRAALQFCAHSGRRPVDLPYWYSPRLLRRVAAYVCG